jgi:hypothetical protein
MQKSGPQATSAELTESDLQLAQENAELPGAIDVLLEKSAEFARRQTEALAGITEMARALTRNEGLAKDRAMLAATPQIFSEECVDEVSAHMGALAAIGALRRSAVTGGGAMLHRWPFMVSVSVH